MKKELRIGNLVKYKYADHPVVVGEILREGIRNNDNIFPYEDLSGIPLTEERLNELGFEKFNDKGDYWEKEGFKLWMSDKDKFYHINSELLVTPDYVHELQNFYFAVTSEEL